MILSKQMLIALCRKALTGLDLDLKGYEEMTKAEQVNFNQDLTKVFYNKSFQKLLNLILKSQVMWIARDSQNETQKNFSRATINAIDMIKDKLEKHTKIFEEKKPEEEGFNKQNII